MSTMIVWSRTPTPNGQNLAALLAGLQKRGTCSVGVSAAGEDASSWQALAVARVLRRGVLPVMARSL